MIDKKIELRGAGTKTILKEGKEIGKIDFLGSNCSLGKESFTWIPLLTFSLFVKETQEICDSKGNIVAKSQRTSKGPAWKRILWSSCLEIRLGEKRFSTGPKIFPSTPKKDVVFDESESPALKLGGTPLLGFVGIDSIDYDEKKLTPKEAVLIMILLATTPDRRRTAR